MQEIVRLDFEGCKYLLEKPIKIIAYEWDIIKQVMFVRIEHLESSSLQERKV